MKVRIFNGTKESYTDWDFDTWKSMYGFEFAGVEEYNIYNNIIGIFKYNRSENIDDNETISRLNKVYNETAWNYYIGDYDRFKYLVDKAKNK